MGAQGAPAAKAASQAFGAAKPWSGRAPPSRSGKITGPLQNRRFCREKFGWFAYYCWAAGLIVLALTLVLG